MQFAESMAVRAREHDRKLVDLPQLCGELSMCQSAARCGWSGYDCSRISRWGKPVRNALRTERSDDQRPVCSTTCWFANMDHRPQAATPEGVVLYGALVRLVIPNLVAKNPRQNRNPVLTALELKLEKVEGVGCRARRNFALAGKVHKSGVPFNKKRIPDIWCLVHCSS